MNPNEIELNDSIADKLKLCPIYKTPEGWIIEYPQFAKLADEQMHTFWPFDEPEVENDMQDLRTNMTVAEQHATTENLKLFTTYEMHVGDDYWTGRVMKKFKRPEIQRMASMNAAVEFNSHAPFYNKVNEILFLDNEEFYSAWKLDPDLTKRMDMIGEYASHKNDLVSLAAFSMIEGAVLYSSFAFFKHFQSQECGKDLLKNVCRGINLSVADEHAHAIGGALLFRTILSEVHSRLTIEEEDYIAKSVKRIAYLIEEHEFNIISKLFAKGLISGITEGNLQDFVKHRINLCLNQLGHDSIYDAESLDGFIEGWFYKDINAVAFHDFFTGSGSEYNLNWKEDRFGSVWGETE
jgi:ribonucleotide reductase beta subunit family protein with ferritin-like domain